MSVLEEMRIRSLGVIDDAVVELSPGFTAVTGETGAGKTMVVTSLGLLLGGRADPALVRIGAKAAVVEGRITVSEGDAAALRAEEAGAELDDGALLISRTVSAEGAHGPTSAAGPCRWGSSPSWRTNSSPCTARPTSRGCSSRRGSAAPSTGTPGTGWRSRTPSTRGLPAAAGRRHRAGGADHPARERAQEADLLRFGLNEVAAVEPLPGEDVELAAEAERLGHAEALASAASLAHTALAGNPEDPESVDATTVVAAAGQALDGVRAHDPALAALADRVGEISILLADVSGELAGYADQLDADPLRLAVVEERRAALTALTRKYGEDITAVLAWAQENAGRLTELEGDDERISELTAERDGLRAELSVLGQALTDARTEAAARFAEAVTEELASLAMPHARVSFAIRQTEAADEASGIDIGGRSVVYGPSGADEVELLLAPHPGPSPGRSPRARRAVSCPG